MRWVALVLLLYGAVAVVASAAVHAVRLLRHHRRADTAQPRAVAAVSRYLLGSALLAVVVCVAFLIDLVVDWPGRWVLSGLVGLLCGAGGTARLVLMLRGDPTAVPSKEA